MVQQVVPSVHCEKDVRLAVVGEVGGPPRAGGTHEAYIGPDGALLRVNDACIRVPTAECTRAVYLSVLPLNSATEGAEFKFVLRTARQVERMRVAQGRREG